MSALAAWLGGWLQLVPYEMKSPPAKQSQSFPVFWRKYTMRTNESAWSQLYQPATIFLIACVGYSVLALLGAWGSGLSRQKDSSMVVGESPKTKDEFHRDPISSVSSLISTIIHIKRKIGPCFFGIMSELESELQETITVLCQIQQLLSLQYALFESRQGMQATLEAVLESLSITISNIGHQCDNFDGTISLQPVGSDLQNAMSRLKTQRESLLYISRSLEPKTPVKPAKAHSNLKDFMESSLIIDETPPKYSPPMQPLTFDKKEPIIVAPPSPSLSASFSSSSSARDIMSTILSGESSELETLLTSQLPPNPNKTSGRLRRTPLHECARLNRTSHATVLLQHGALGDEEDAKGDTPLHLACWESHLEVTEVLLKDVAADPNRLSGRDGSAAIDIAIAVGSKELVALLIKYGANLDVKNEGEMTLLHLAAIMEQHLICKLLIDNGANLEEIDAQGNTPLHYAAVSGNVECIQVLLDAGANIHARQENGLTPVHWASREGKTDAVKVLTAANAKTLDIDEDDVFKET
jgi:ankyrin repeat protein